MRVLTEHSDGVFITGSDAQLILGDDEGAMIQLWREKRCEVKPHDASIGLAIQLGAAAENLNRRWCEKASGYAITSRRRVVHPVHRWMAANLDGRIEAIGAVFEAEFVPALRLSAEEATERFMAQLQHDMWVSASRWALLSVITGGAEWMGILVHADALYQHLLLTAERKFWRCVQSGEPPRLFGIDLPRPTIEPVRTIDTGSEGLREANEPGKPPVFPVSAPRPVISIRKPVRERDQHHLRFVGTQPCLICGRRPTDAHHIKFAQLPAMGRKVSDRFTVPLCRLHHRELHDRGNERLWWQERSIDPLTVAARLWGSTHDDDDPERPDELHAPIV